MEGRKRSGMLKKSVYNMRKRLVAFALAAAMVCTNVGADLNAAYAATSSSESVTFEMTGSQLVTAIEEAIEYHRAISTLPMETLLNSRVCFTERGKY